MVIVETMNLKRTCSTVFDQKMLPLKKRKLSLEALEIETISLNVSPQLAKMHKYLNESSLLESSFSEQSDSDRSVDYSSEDSQSIGSPIQCNQNPEEPAVSSEDSQNCVTPPAPVQLLKTVPLFPQLAKLLTAPITPQGQPNIICIIASRQPAIVQNYR